jgi:hypothetical protein
MIRRRLLLMLALAVAITGVSGVAWAFWMAVGSGTGNATAGTLNPPTGVAAPATSTGNVQLSWTASTGAPAPTGYYVTRVNESNSSTALACGTSPTSTVSGTTCSDLSVPTGNYHYTATAVYRSWTATSSASGSVAVNNQVLTSITISPASASIAAGGSRSYVATGHDQNGDPMGDVTASTTFAISPNGSCTGATCTATVADSGGSHHTVTGNYSGKTSTASLTVTPAAASTFVVAGFTSPTIAGIVHTFAVTAKDSFGNTATGYTGTAHFSSNDPQAVLPTDYIFTAADAGFRSGLSATLKTAGSRSITSTDTVTGSITGAQSSITVTPASASRLVLAASTITPSAGAADNLTITALDAYDNTAISYTGDKNLTFTGAGIIGSSTPTVSSNTGAAVTFGGAVTVTFSSGVASTSGSNNGVMTLYKAGATTIGVTDGTITNGSGLLVTVSPLSASRLAWTNVTVSPGTLSTPCLFACTANALGNFGTFTARVSVTDTYGNTVSNLGTGHSVTVSTPTSGGGSGGAFTSPSAGSSVVLTISGVNAADSTGTFTFKAQNGSWTSDSLTATTQLGTTYTVATATVAKS